MVEPVEVFAALGAEVERTWDGEGERGVRLLGTRTGHRRGEEETYP